MIINPTIAGGGTQPTGTTNITGNGIHNVASYEFADVQVPTTAPAHYIERINDNGTLKVNGVTSVIDLTGITTLGEKALTYAYVGDTALTTLPDFSNITTINGYNVLDHAFWQCSGLTGNVDFHSLNNIIYGSYAFTNAFTQCTNITSADFSGLEIIGEKNNDNFAAYCFQQCRNLVSINLSSLKYIGAYSCFSYAFDACNSLSSVDLGSLEVVGHTTKGGNFSYAFQGCTSLTTMNLSNVYAVNYQAFQNAFKACTNLTSCNLNPCWVNNAGMSYIFANCSGLTSYDLSRLCLVGPKGLSNAFNGSRITSIDLSHVAVISGDSSFASAFAGGAHPTSLSFPKLAAIQGTNTTAFNKMLQGVTGCTVHFPSDMQSVIGSWADVTAGFGGTNTTVLFDLPAVNGVVDLTPITKIEYAPLIQNTGTSSTSFFYNCTGITSVDFSNLEEARATEALKYAFYGCSGLTTVYLNKLTYIGVIGLSSCFYNCSNLTTIDLRSLETVWSGGINYAFYGCSSLVTQKFESLKDISILNDNYQPPLGYAFQNCTALQNVYFYALDTNSFGGSTKNFKSMLQGCSGVTVHFPMRIQSTIGSWADVTAGFGGTNTTVLFDIVTTITGADSNSYVRTEKNSTPTATAWDLGGVLYYTSATAEPVIGDNVYSDDTLTTVVTTVSAIA